VNRSLSKSQQIKRLKLLPRSLSQDEGELTPSLKIKRPIVAYHFQDEIEDMYRDEEKTQRV
jgi:long-chain acyl-CoA synthetase